MMRLSVMVACVAILVSACSGAGASSPSQTSTPPVPTTDLLRRSDEVMKALRYFKVSVDVRPTASTDPPYRYQDEFLGARCIRSTYTGSTNLPRGDCPCGWSEFVYADMQYRDRASGGLIGGLPFGGATVATDVQLLRSETFDGHRAFVISYQFKVQTEEGAVNIYRKEWLDAESLLLLRQEQDDDDRFGVRPHVVAVLSDFDAPSQAGCLG